MTDDATIPSWLEDHHAEHEGVRVHVRPEPPGPGDRRPGRGRFTALLTAAPHERAVVEVESAEALAEAVRAFASTVRLRHPDGAPVGDVLPSEGEDRPHEEGTRGRTVPGDRPGRR